MARIAALLLLVAACSTAEDALPADTGAAAPDVSGDTPPDAAFPEGFLFGTAVAGFQVDMGCPTLAPEACEDPASDWYAFITSPVTLDDPATYLHGDPPSAGPGHWELYEADFDRVKGELSNNGFRFSLEWSRIFPTATDGIEGYDALRAVASKAALDTYHAMFAALKARGITPLVTLNHYTLPSWIHDAVGCHQDLATCSPRGWVDRERTVAEIAKYAGFCAREFGAEVDLWATENEPFAVILPGYVLQSPDRTNPPAVVDHAAAKVVFRALIEAHARMYDAVKAGDLEDANGDGKASEVGIVYALAPAKPADPTNPKDVEGAERLFYLWNGAFLNAVVKGDFDAELDGTSVHRTDLAGRMDYIGINYYTRITVIGADQPLLPELSPLSTFVPAQLWEDYTKGIYDMAMVVKEYGLPAIVTETGAQDPKDDGTSGKWLIETLSWVQRAIADGADVRGYFYWTLMDNYEWNHGMAVRMGLYAVDPQDPTKARTARKSVAEYAEVAAQKRIPDALRAKYPID